MATNVRCNGTDETVYVNNSAEMGPFCDYSALFTTNSGGATAKEKRFAKSKSQVIISHFTVIHSNSNF